MRSFKSFVGFFFAVNKRSKLVSKNFFLFVYAAVVPLFHFINGFKRKESEHTKAFHNIGISDIAPVLIKLERRRLFRIKPNSSLCSFTHLFTLAVKKQGYGHGVCIVAGLFANQFGSAKHIAPLVIAAKLHIAAIMSMKIIKIIGLHNHIVKLKKAKSLFHTLLIAFGTKHVVYGEAGSDISKKFNIV